MNKNVQDNQVFLLCNFLFKYLKVMTSVLQKYILKSAEDKGCKTIETHNSHYITTVCVKYWKARKTCKLMWHLNCTSHFNFKLYLMSIILKEKMYQQFLSLYNSCFSERMQILRHVHFFFTNLIYSFIQSTNLKPQLGVCVISQISFISF